MSRHLPQAVLVACAGLLLSGIPAIAQAAPSMPADPQFRALAAASAYTNGLTLSGANVHWESRSVDPAATAVLISDLGFDAYRGDYAMRSEGTFQFSEPVAANTRRAPLVLPWGSYPARASADARADEVATFVAWSGHSAEGPGDFDYLDQSMLGPVEKRALRNLGAADATFTVRPGSSLNVPLIQREVSRINPADFLPSVVDGDANGQVQVGTVTAVPGEAGSTIYTVPVTMLGSSFALPYVVTVDADGIVRRLTLDFAVEETQMSVHLDVALVSWGPGKPVDAVLPVGAATIDADLYAAEVEYLHRVAELRFTARELAGVVNDAAKLTGVPVTARIIRAAGERLTGTPYDVANVPRGISVSVNPDSDRFACDIITRERGGLRVAASRCRALAQAPA